jgi:hypothetical protein
MGEGSSYITLRGVGAGESPRWFAWDLVGVYPPSAELRLVVFHGEYLRLVRLAT